MTTRNFIPLPELPTELTHYCALNNYPLSGKKKHIIAHVLLLNQDTDIETLVHTVCSQGIKVSRSSVYAVLQWLITHNLVSRTVTGHAQNVLYAPVKTKVLTRQHNSANLKTPSFALHALQNMEAVRAN
jgi:Fe2+ or Zn2+ uptake regulation protein